MTPQLDIAYTTMVAELLERTLDAQFDADFDESGLFRLRPVDGRNYWYFKPSERGTAKAKDIYVGPADDSQIAQRVENFARIKDDFKRRRKIVSTLTRDARLFSPEARVGNVVEALWKAGLFRVRACLVGTIAYQTYGTVLGYRMAGAALQTGDIDIAQFHSVSVAVDDSIPPILDVLKTVDEGFQPIPQLGDQHGASKFQTTGGLRVEFLTPNRGSDDYSGKSAKLPALGGASATPLRFLDFLIHEPVRTVMLHKGGIPVLVPDAARYAVHKLIVAARRRPGEGKADKDLRQAYNLARALSATGRLEDLREVYEEARSRGPQWREAIDASLKRLSALGVTDFEVLKSSR